MKLIFDKQGNLKLTTSSDIPFSHNNDNYVIAELAENETFDFKYNYIINSEGFATRGELKPVDTAEVARITAELAATQYQRERRDAYPQIVDQLDTLYHGGYDAWKAEIAAIKAQYPKPTGGNT